MAASDHLHPEQLQLFMTGTELKNRITDSIDRAPMRSMDDMWKSKLRESKGQQRHGGGTYQSLKKNGWQGEGPGILHRREYSVLPEWDKDHMGVNDAHHRIAAAADIEAKSKGKREIYIPTTDQHEFPSLKPKDRLED